MENHSKPSLIGNECGRNAEWNVYDKAPDRALCHPRPRKPQVYPWMNEVFWSGIPLTGKPVVSTDYGQNPLGLARELHNPLMVPFGILSAASGSWMMNFVPLFSSDSNAIEPLCVSMMLFAINNPRPDPSL
mgnify:CR=1 FL=1